MPKHPASPIGTKLCPIPTLAKKYCLIYIRGGIRQLVQRALCSGCMFLPWLAKFWDPATRAGFMAGTSAAFKMPFIHLSWYHGSRQKYRWCPEWKYLLQASLPLLSGFIQHCSCNSLRCLPVCPPQSATVHYPVACGLLDHGRSMPNDQLTNFPNHDPATLPSMHFGH